MVIAADSFVDQSLSPSSSVTYNLSLYVSGLVPSIPVPIASAASFASERLDNVLHEGGSIIAKATGCKSRYIFPAAPM